MSLGPAHGMEDGGELFGEREQAPVGGRLLIVESIDQAGSGQARGGDAGGDPRVIEFGEEAGDMAPAASLAGLAGFTYQHDEEVEAVAGGIDHAVGAGADDVAESGEQLEEDGGGMSLGVRGEGADGEPGEAVKGSIAEYGMLGRGGRLWLRRGESRAGLLLWLGLGLDAEQFVSATLYVGECGQDGPGYPRACVAYHNSTLVRFLMFVEKSLVTSG